MGDCDAKQMLRQLNMFFTEEEVAAAVASLPLENQPMPAKMTDGGSDKPEFKAMKAGAYTLPRFSST